MCHKDCKALLVLLLGLTACAVGYADQYWGYTYRNIDVTAVGNAKYATTLVSNLRKLDIALTRTVAADLGAERRPVHIYALPKSLIKELWGKESDFSSEFIYSDFGSDVILDSDGVEESRYAGLYFGYAGSVLLGSINMAAYPDWVRVGYSSIFGATRIAGNRVTIGGFLPTQAQNIQQETLIPVRSLFSLRQFDPQLQSPERESLFESESWFLMHQLIVEGKYADNFRAYLSRLNEGKGQDEAFASSFNVSYEELDRFLQQAIARGVIRTVVLTIPDEPATSAPEPLSLAEFTGRTARFAVGHNRELAHAMAIARKALTAEPANEQALRAIAIGDVRLRQFDDALRMADKLTALPALSAPGRVDLAAVQTQIADAVAAKSTTSQIDAAALRRQSIENLQLVVQSKRDDIPSWVELMKLVAASGDRAAATDLLPSAEAAFYRQPQDAYLPRGMTNLSISANDYERAFKYAVAWRKNARNNNDRDEASGMVERLRDYLARLQSAGSRLSN